MSTEEISRQQLPEQAAHSNLSKLRRPYARPAGSTALHTQVSRAPAHHSHTTEESLATNELPGEATHDTHPTSSEAHTQSPDSSIDPPDSDTEQSTNYPARPDPSDPAAEVWGLVEQVQAGDMEAFGQIYDRYVDTVFRFVYFRVGNRQLAEDLTSDTFERGLKRIDSLTWQGRDLGAWLVTIGRNLVADHFKSGRYRLEVTTDDMHDPKRNDHPPSGDNPEQEVLNRLTEIDLLALVERLNPKQRECIKLRLIKGYSVAEAAEKMGINTDALKALQYRATRNLGIIMSGKANVPKISNDPMWKIVEIAQQKDEKSPEAARALYRKYGDDVLRYIHSRVRDQKRAALLTSRVFKELISTANTHDPKEYNVGAWLRAAARRTATQYLFSQLVATRNRNQGNTRATMSDANAWQQE